MCGLFSSVYPLDVDRVAQGVAVPIGASILDNPLIITDKNLVGTSGLMRMYFTIGSAADADFGITLTRNRIGGQFGVSAEAEAQITDGVVTNIKMINTGNGYPIGLTGANTTVTLSGGDGLGATAVPVIERGQIVSINITNGGVDYTIPPDVVITSTAFTSISERLNSDNNFALKSGGYYRFDIGVRVGDELDFLVATANVTTVEEFRLDQIQIGA